MLKLMAMASSAVRRDAKTSGVCDTENRVNETILKV
jgi:hypothetical protein